MSARINLLNEPELPPPHEKLLRAPTFSEKYGWVKWFIIAIFVVGVLDYGIIKALNVNIQEQAAPSNQKQLTVLSPAPPSNIDEEQLDPTRNWNPYNNDAGKFTFKYPDGYTLTENASKDTVQLASNQLPNDMHFLLTFSFKPITGDAMLSKLALQNPVCGKISSEKLIHSSINGQQPAQLYVDTSCGKELTSVIYTVNENLLYIITIQSKSQFTYIKPYADKILSTLRFSDSEESNGQTVCTQEAKQCPDGSWVGRTGPNCEFVCAEQSDNNSWEKKPWKGPWKESGSRWDY